MYEGQGRPLLDVEQVSIAYGDLPILRGLSLKVWPGQIAALIGPNGAGKTTLLKAVGGLLRPVQGRILFGGEAVQELPVWELVRRGVVYVPEGMETFPQMTVQENLEVGGYLNRAEIPARLAMVYGLFPELGERRLTLAGALSGGQQRMVTLARSLMAGARLLLLDDPFLGFSPNMVKRFAEVFKRLPREGLTLCISGQHVRHILALADTAFLLEQGAVGLSGPGAELLRQPQLQERLFGLEAAGEK
jgi:branched-chain amino acid transport system ATP-binding protein